MLIRFLDLLITIYIVLIFASSILSWFGSGVGGLRELVDSMVDPVLAPIRRTFPPSGIDFSPTAAILILIVLRALIHGGL